MKTLLLVVVLFSLGTALGRTALGQTDEELRRDRDARRAKWERLWAIEDRIYRTRPQRRDAPLREENIRDEEVREIQAASRGVLPDAIVNISGVVTGCPCEEGPLCSDQVWILASRADRTLGLQMSKIGNVWTIGLIQKWWFEYEALQKRQKSFRSYSEFKDAEDALKEQFPRCAVQPKKTTPGVRKP